MILTGVVFFAACSGKFVGRSYEGPDLPESEVGTVVFDSVMKLFNNQVVVSCKIDGQRVDMDPKTRSVKMPPGKRTILFMYRGNGPRIAVEWIVNIEAGHKYLITFSDHQPASGPLLRLEDRTTGQHLIDVDTSHFRSSWTCF
jgi:hypothetical protein